MTHLLTDPKVIEALNGLVAVLIAGLGGAAAVGFARLKASMESHLQRATRAAEEAKQAAQSADEYPRRHRRGARHREGRQ